MRVGDTEGDLMSELDETMTLPTHTAEPTRVDGLSAEGIVVRFGGLVAVEGVHLQAPRGRITGLIGPNGAGKTTTFNVCCGYQRANAGTVRLDGRDLTHDSPSARAALGMGRTFQRMELFGGMTVRENIALAAESRSITSGPLSQLGLTRGGRARARDIAATTSELLARTGLDAVADRPAAQISTGQGRLVELARALARDPQILLLDEPSSGLDHAESEAFGALLVDLVAERNLGILMVEHDMSLVLTICGWIHVLDFGRPLLDGTSAEVRNSDAVRQAYLGTLA
jgi:ABC-type branched-subunit amino acid transport system ATPase component